jgi:hypothetical protein
MDLEAERFEVVLELAAHDEAVSEVEAGPGTDVELDQDPGPIARLGIEAHDPHDRAVSTGCPGDVLAGDLFDDPRL